MTASDLTTAQEAITHLFETLTISRVISVDDLYTDEHTADDLIGLLDATPTAAAAIPELQQLNLTVDPDIWHERLRTLFSALEASRQITILQQVRAATGDNQELDKTVGGTMGQLFEKYDFQPLTLTQWQQQKTALLDNAAMPNTLVLFDQSFTKEGGTETTGLDLIKDAYARCTHPGLLCGLLSQNYTIEQEFESWQRLAADHNIEADRFVLIAKERLEGRLVGFASQIKLTVLNKQCNALKQEAIQLLQNAHQAAGEQLRAMNIYDFEHIVFRSSQREGVWEPDTLFRIFGLYHRTATRQLAKQSVPLAQQATAIRKVSSLPIPNEAALRHNSWKIQRLELYEEDEHLNGHHLPTDLGDIYQKSNGDKRFILLAQPCDLMVRNDKEPGRRSGMYEATVAEIVDEKPKNEHASVELKYFDPSTGRSAYVHLGRIHTIKLCVLDLCVLQTDGHAKLAATDQCPETVIPSWQRYFVELQKDAKKILSRYQELTKGKKDPALIALLTRANYKGFIRGDINSQEQRIEYKIKRVRRLLQPRAGEMLSRYAAYKTRNAFEHDFGDLPETPPDAAG